MEERKQGGKRLGAGRKPILNKKKTVTLYVEQNKILPFGGEEKMKGELYGFITNYGAATSMLQDLTKPTNDLKPHEQPKTNYEVKMPPKPETVPIGNSAALQAKILATTIMGDLEAVMREVKNSLLPGGVKRQLEELAKAHAEKRGMYND